MARKLTKKNTKVQKVVKKKVVEKIQPHMADAAARLKMPTGEYIEAIGRRKTATARVRLYKQAGDFIVNNKAAGQYFATVNNAQVVFNKPLRLLEVQGQYALSAVVNGSGIKAQLTALTLGISRALVKLNPEYKGLLKAEGLLTRDDRMKETRKIGTGGKARRKRQSPKR